MWNYEGFSSHVRLGRELIYEINNIFFSRRSRRGAEKSEGKSRCGKKTKGGAGGKGRGERRRRYGEGRGTRGETHKAAYVSSVMRTGDFSFRARECKRKMKARSSFSLGVGASVCGCHHRGFRRWRRHRQKLSSAWYRTPPAVGSAVLRKPTRSCI